MKGRWIYTVVVLVLLLGPIAKGSTPVRAGEVYPSEIGEALVLLESTNVVEMEAAIHLIQEQGVQVLASFPEQGLLVRVSEVQAEQLQHFPVIREITFERADLSLAGEDEGAFNAILCWNYRLSPATPEGPVALPELPDNDMLIPDDWELQQKPRQSNQSIANPSQYQTSEYMLQDIQVDVFLPESDGSIDGNYENWTTSMRNQVVAEVTNGILWWASTATQGGKPSADLTANIVFHTPFNEPSIVATGYEPIRRPHSDEGLWMGQIMSHLGYSDSYLSAIRQYAHDRRTTSGRDWAFTVWVVNSLNDADGMFTDNRFGYAYFFGPAIVMTYDNDSWGIDRMEIVTAHEMGHTFGALDEYASSGCTDSERGGYLNIANTNCENGDPPTEDSIMRSASSQQIAYPNHLASTPVRGMVGWRDSDGDRLYDPGDTTPTIDLGAYSPDPTEDNTPTWLGQTQDVPYPSPVHSDVSINYITQVQYRMDEGTWANCTASDGYWNETEESFTCTPPALSDGSHTIQVRSRNRVSHYSSLASDTLRIDAHPPTTTMAHYAGSLAR